MADQAQLQTAKTAERAFVLVSTYRDGPCKGQPQYYRCWTVIGPAATPNLEEAERFETAQAAMQSPAYVYWASFYEPLEIGAA